MQPLRRRRHACAAILGVLAVVSMAGAQEKPAEKPAEAPAQTPNQAPQYVGSDTCEACHEDTYKAFFQTNPHRLVQTDKKYNHVSDACEACHGPGSKHAESMNAADIIQPAKLKPSATDRICLSCHLNQPTNVGRINNSHAKNQVSCVSCHSVHKNGGLGIVARKPVEINALCASCHGDIWASFAKPYRHRLPEGAMSCADCHNPHGSAVPQNMRLVQANEPGCFKCHGNLRGPFVFEHAPVQLQQCSACHEPHGSANPRMLTRPKVMFVCLECHANLPGPTAPTNGTLGTVPPAFHDIRQPRFQNCTLCHQMIHGSYVNPELLR